MNRDPTISEAINQNETIIFILSLKNVISNLISDPICYFVRFVLPSGKDKTERYSSLLKRALRHFQTKKLTLFEGKPHE